MGAAVGMIQGKMCKSLSTEMSTQDCNHVDTKCRLLPGTHRLLLCCNVVCKIAKRHTRIPFISGSRRCKSREL